MNIVVLGVGLLVLQAQLASVSGVVTRPGGNGPLAGATVTLNPVFPAESARIRSTVSAEDGRFTVSDVEPGDYRLQVQSQFYGFATYGERKPNGPGAILTIGAGQRLSDLKITMTPTGTIAGRITGRNGEPLAYANVQALKYLYQAGRRTLSAVQTTTTDDRGEYRLYWLTSGRYVVVAGPRSSPITTEPVRPLIPGETLRTSGLPAALLLSLGQTPDALLEATSLVKRILEDGSAQEESWMPTYYPSTIDRSRATSIDVSVGSTVTGIDITLGPSPVQKIRGRVTGVTPASQVMVSLASGTPGMLGRAMTKGISSIDGSFEFAGVVPGMYFLTAQDRAGLVAMPIAVSVADRDVEELSMALSTGITLSVRVTAEGLTQGPTDPLTGLFGTLVPELDAAPGSSPANIRAPSVQFGAGNVFLFPNLVPGDYQFTINQSVLRDNVKRLYVKSARLGREDALGTVHVSSESDVLEVVLTTRTGSVEGVTVDRAGDPAANATVVLVPANARKRTSLYAAAITGKDGKYRFQEVPPGDYKLFAWDDIETGAWENAEFMRSYESRGRSLHISENGKEEVELSVIYNP